MKNWNNDCSPSACSGYFQVNSETIDPPPSHLNDLERQTSLGGSAQYRLTQDKQEGPNHWISIRKRIFSTTTKKKKKSFFTQHRGNCTGSFNKEKKMKNIT